MAVTYRCPRYPACTESHQYHPRASDVERGYGNARWRKFRKGYLAQHPTCSGVHSLCERHGRTTAATDVDHNIPVVGGQADPSFWTGPYNALCRACHMAKTRLEHAP